MKKKILKLTLNNKDYPQNLLFLPEKEIPEKLFILGNLKEEDIKAIAVVGARQMSSYGEKTAKTFVRKFVQEGFTIVSGLAKGIDSVSHKEALDSGGRTIAVLGSGLDNIYPAENKKLAQEIIKKGALLSEYESNVKPLGKHFLERNRIIAGLAIAVVVVEGKRRSGTLSTASWAANYGREVFAVPGSINSVLSGAPHYLIKNGAKLVENANEVLDEIENMLE